MPGVLNLYSPNADITALEPSYLVHRIERELDKISEK